MVLDPLSIGIVTLLISNGLNVLLNCGLGKAKKIAKQRDSIRKALEADTILVSTVRDVLGQIAKTPLLSSNELRATMLQLFLESPTAESIVRQIYCDFLPRRTQEKPTGELQKEFQISLAHHLGASARDTEQLASELFEVICMGCRKALNLAISRNILSAHEAKSIARHRVISDELRAISSNLNFLMTRSDLDLNAIKDFEKKYRRQVSQRYRQITIPHFDRAPLINIDKIFVSPNFVFAAREKGTEPETLSMGDFLIQLYRIVVLGDPGGGKSTLAQKTCYELSRNYERRFLGGRLLTPVLVVLREYSLKKKQEGVSIIQFMESEVTSKYQLPQGAPTGAFEYLLNNGHLLVIFDGLDELLDPSHRREMSADIESFCNLFPAVPVLVTSRLVGYEQAPLDSTRFEAFRLAPFDDEQVSEYAQKWFANDPNLTEGKGKSRAESFLGESRIVSDLRSNPLMLALMCNLYRGAGFIPRNRPEVYKKCSEMLLERWDRSRGIWVHLPLPEPKFLVSHLACWIYSNEPLQSGTPENVLIREATKFLQQRRFESEEEAEKASKEFLECCRGRAWVFTDVGTTIQGTRLYNFTHKTFLEYYTAVNIVRNHNTSEKLWNLLGPRIAEGAWDVVAQLAFQMLHEQVEGASDEMLMLLVQDSQKKKAARLSYLSFGARCLQFIYPSPRTIRALTETIVRNVIEGILPSRGRSGQRHVGGFDTAELINALLLASFECRSLIADSVQGEVANYANNKGDKMAVRAMTLGLNLPYHWFGPRLSVKPEFGVYWSAVEKKIFEQVDERLCSLAPNNFQAFMLWFRGHDMPVEKLFAWYTPDHLFLRVRDTVVGNSFPFSIAEQILLYLSVFGLPVLQQMSETLDEQNKTAAEIGKILLNTPLPCFSHDAVRAMFPRGTRLHFLLKPQIVGLSKTTKGGRITVSMTGDAVIGAWCLCAVIVEAMGKKEELVRQLKESRSPATKAICGVIEARVHMITPDKALRNLRKFNPPQTALGFVERWITGQVSFVQLPEAKEES